MKFKLLIKTAMGWLTFFKKRPTTNELLAANEIMQNSRNHVSFHKIKKIEVVQKFEWCPYNIDAYVCNLEIKIWWNKSSCSQEIVNWHFERKECFLATSWKVLCKFLMEANVPFSLSDAYRIITLMPMFAMYRVKVEIITAEVLTAVLWE